jgi:hypothetical protein
MSVNTKLKGGFSGQREACASETEEPEGRVEELDYETVQHEQ